MRASEKMGNMREKWRRIVVQKEAEQSESLQVFKCFSSVQERLQVVCGLITSFCSPWRPSSTSWPHASQSPGKRTDSKTVFKNRAVDSKLPSPIIPGFGGILWSKVTVKLMYNDILYIRYLSGSLEWVAVCDSFTHHVSTVSSVLNENSLHFPSCLSPVPDHRQLLPWVNSTCEEADVQF